MYDSQTHHETTIGSVDDRRLRPVGGDAPSVHVVSVEGSPAAHG